MAGRGPAKTDPERRQRRNRPHELVVVSTAGEVEPLADSGPPICPTGLLKTTRDRWDGYWAAPVAKLADPVSDLPALERLFRLYDDLERSYQSVRKSGHMVEGSQGQAVMNPLLRHMQTVMAEVRQLEDRFGLSPRARLGLNLTLGATAKTIADLNADFSGGVDDDDPRRDYDVIDGEVRETA